MKTPLIGLTLLAFAHAGTIVGFEDIRGLDGSDRDFNDVEISVSGVSFALSGPFHFPGYQPPFCCETPLPDGYFFSGATATGNLVSGTFFSAESALFGQVGMRDLDNGNAGWILRDGMTVGIPTSAGDRVLFFELADPSLSFTWYSDLSLNVDGLTHAAVTFTPESRQSETPEPGTWVLAFCGIAAVTARRGIPQRAAR